MKQADYLDIGSRRRWAPTRTLTPGRHWLVAAALVTAARANVIPGDQNSDARVDLQDVASLQRCFTGSGFTPDAGCESFDLNHDDDVDSNDFSLIRCAIGGPDHPFQPLTFTDPDELTTSPVAAISGAAHGSTMVELSRGPISVTNETIDCAFSAQIPLQPNAVNQLHLRAVYGDGTTSSAVPITITHDQQPPSLFIDYPAHGAEITTAVTDVAGRVGDPLSGFMGLMVTVNGVSAAVDVGIGTNGTFFLAGVPLAPGDNSITAVATDQLGNSRQVQITVERVAIPIDAPRMEVVSGNGQVTQMGTPLPLPIVVRATHADGAPFANKLVTFDVTRSNGRLSADGAGSGTTTLQAFTDAGGSAMAYWTLGYDAGCGNNRVEVTSADIAGTTIFCASATPAPARQINVGSGGNQRGETSGPALEPLRVWVSDGCNGVPDVPVTFTVSRGDGSINGEDGALVMTGPTGHAEVALTLGATPGNNVVEATFPSNGGPPARFVAYGVARDPTQATTFSGLILDNANQPLQGVECTLVVGSFAYMAVADVDGRFVFDGLQGSGASWLVIDGRTAFHVGGVDGTDVPTGSFPRLEYEPILIPNVENSLSSPILLPRLNPENEVIFDNTQDVELTVEGIEGLKMIVRAGSMTREDGTIPSPEDPAVLALNQVRHDDVPMPIPDGAAPPFAWTLQPSGATFDPPIEIIYPNMTGLPAGSIAYFLSFNHDTMRFEIVSSGHVTDDGRSIVSDPGGGLSTAGWGCNCPPYSVTGDCCGCPATECVQCENGQCVVVDNPCCGAEPGTPCDRDDDPCTLDECGEGKPPICEATGLGLCDDSECAICDNGACMPECGGDPCLVCEDGACVPSSDICCAVTAGSGICCPPCADDETCCNGTCCGPCETCTEQGCESFLLECHICQDGMAVPDCAPCEECQPEGCQSVLSECQRCENGVPVSDCEPCHGCFGDECVSLMQKCHVCVDGEVQDDCPPCHNCIFDQCQPQLLACEECGPDGEPVSTCGPCEACVNDECVTSLKPCQECVDGQPVDDCEPCEFCFEESCAPTLLSCQSCQDGQAVDDCVTGVCCGDAPGTGECCAPCEVCADGECVSTMLACQTCQDGQVVDNCGDGVCCGDAPGEGVCCEPCEGCFAGQCYPTMLACQSCQDGQIVDDCADGVCCGDDPGTGECCDSCDNCFAGQCLPALLTCETCQDGQAADDCSNGGACCGGLPGTGECCDPCDNCFAGECVPTLLACQTCENGQPVDDCPPGGECCGGLAGTGECCDPCDLCAEGQCFPTLFACQTCENGIAVDNCPNGFCCSALAGTGECCDPCDHCLDGQCIPALLACQSCQNGLPVSDCPPDSECCGGLPGTGECCDPCDFCFDGECVPTLLACQSCQNDQPVDDCAPGFCCGALAGTGECCNAGQTCVNGVCTNP